MALARRIDAERRQPRSRARFFLAFGLLGILAPLSGGAVAAPSDPLEQGDAAWSRRADGNDGNGRAARGPIDDAIAAYEAAIAAEPEGLEPRWKLVRALHFASDFASRGEDDTRSLLDRATAESQRAFDVLGARMGDRDVLDEAAPDAVARAVPPADRADAAALHFWSAIAWGGWAQQHGLLGAVREGVANRIRRGALVTLALDPSFEEGGAHRLLARLHATLPRVPILSGWVDRSKALPEMERAIAISPQHLGNRMLLALTLLDVAPERRSEALRLLEGVSAATPQAPQLVEEQAIRKAARARLDEERSASR